MNYPIIDAHAHLWLRQDTVVEGLPVRTLENGRSLFMGEIRQMLGCDEMMLMFHYIHLAVQ